MGNAEFGFDNAPVGLAMTSHRLIAHCNARFAGMFGYAVEDLKGLSIALLYPSDREFVDVGRWALQAMTHGLRYEDQRIMKKRDGTQFWCSVHGQSTTPHDPFALCVWSFADLSTVRPVVQLTRREREIAIFIVEGLPNKEIARRLGISHRTIEAHRSRMMQKLDARNPAEFLSILTGFPNLR